MLTSSSRRIALEVGTVVAAAAVAAAVMGQQQDLVLYRLYAMALFHQPLAHAMPHEYPALTSLLFAGPYLSHIPYDVAFGLVMATAFGALMFVGRAFGAIWQRRVLLYVLLGPVYVMLGRYDLLVALTIVLAVRAARREHWPAAWGWVLAATLLKVFPIVLLPGFIIAERRRTGRYPLRRSIALTAVLLGIGAIQQVVAPGTVLHPLQYEAHRGFEYSSLPGSITFLLDPAGAQWHRAYLTTEIFGPGFTVLSVVMIVAAIAGLGAVWVLAFRGRLTVEAVSLLVITILILTNKSFAPQYLLWLAPLWAFWRLRRSWILVAIITAVTFPLGSGIAMRLGFPPLLFITTIGVVRNLVLVAGSLAWLGEILRASSVEPATLADMSLNVSTPVEGQLACLAR